MTNQPTGDPTDRLTFQQIDALWDAVAIPGPTEPTFPMQHERVCRAVAEILDEMAPTAPVVPVSSPPPDQTAACICGHTEAQHFEDVCQVCDCGDYLVPEAAREVIARWRAAAGKAERIRENADFHLGQEMARRQLAEKEADRLREELRRLAAEAQQPDTEALRAKVDEATATLRRIRSTLRTLRDQGATGRTYYEEITEALAGPRPDRYEPTAEEPQPDTETCP